MERKTTDKKLLYKIDPNPINLGIGVDSYVYSIQGSGKPMILKRYLGVATDRWKPNKQTLEQYYSDTEKAKNLLEKNPNPLKQFVIIYGERYYLKYEIISQGGIILKNTGQHIDTGDVWESLGQKFVSGLNLADLKPKIYSPIIRGKKAAPDPQQVFFQNNVELLEKIAQNTKSLFHYLQNETSIPFSYANVNVKPFIDQGKKTIIITITDLVAELKPYTEQQLTTKQV